MHRRDLLRLLAVTGLAGCSTGIAERDVPLVEAAPASRPPPTPGPTASASPPETEPRSPSPGSSARAASPAADEPRPPAAPEATGEPEPEPAPTSDDPTSVAPTTEPVAEHGGGDPAPTHEPAPGDDPAPTDAATDDREDPRVVVAISRRALGLPAPRSGGREHRITGLAVHHTASPTAPAHQAPARFRSITTAHRDQGWIDAAYHWGVDVAGNVYELRDPAVAGDTNTDYDPAGWFLVVCEGNFEESSPPRAMLDALADVLAAGAARYGVAPATLRGHRDLAATLCPGANLQARLGDLRTAVERRLAAGGVVIRPDDDPARVARIERG